jgi:hypothetical protein
VAHGKRSYLDTEYNLARRWQRSVKCCFCNLNKSIHHLFFDCHDVKKIETSTSFIQFIFPLNVNDMFFDYLQGVCRKLKYQALVGGMCYVLGNLTRHEFFSFVHVLFRGTH